MSLLPENLPDDLIVINCAGCGKLMQPTIRCQKKFLPYEGGWILGRPYCDPCLNPVDTVESLTSGEHMRTEGQRLGSAKTKS